MPPIDDIELYIASKKQFFKSENLNDSYCIFDAFILNFKMFELYQQNEEFCLGDFFSKSQEWLDNKVFETVSMWEASGDEKTYVQIKILMVRTRDRNVKVL